MTVSTATEALPFFSSSTLRNKSLWVIVAVLLAGLAYFSTYQIHISGSWSPYATDVGEIQNALPRWGLIHHSGYPQYSVLGSLFVTVLRPLGIAPAAGASLFSVFWGLVTVALLVILAMDLAVPGPFAALGALATAVSTSIWIDASLAEVHTMTLAISVATVLFALRYGREGRRSDLLWLTFVFSQGVFHQRSVVLLGPAVLLLIWPHLRDIFRLDWRSWLLLIGIALLAPLTYLYLPLRVWTGADWVFGSPGTWDGFWTLFLDNRAGRVFDLNSDWAERLRTTHQILADDMFWPLLVAGLFGLWLPALEKGQRLVSLGLTAAWVPNYLVTVIIWRNRVVDAQLAAKLPLLLLAGIGLSLILAWLWRRSARVAALAGLVLLAGLTAWSWQARPFIAGITRDRSSEAIVETMRRVSPAEDGRTTTVAVPWGADYWALTYAQAYRDELAGLNLVDHNAEPQMIIRRGDHFLVPNQTLMIFPLIFYEERLGPLYLAAAAPDVTEISPAPIVSEAGLAGLPAFDFDLGNGVTIRAVTTEWAAENEVMITVYWQAPEGVDANYSVAVHLVAQDPPQSEADILDQDDRAAPVNNWYPTMQWRPGEIVRDRYVVSVPEGSTPAGIRVGMYRSDPELGFINTPWLSLPLPPE
ncbi:MAG: protein O-mannosyl-transferase family [Candidatus Promineifilaceae bacterium]